MTKQDYLVKLNCPVCGKRIADRNFDSNLIIWDTANKQFMKLIPDLVEKCGRCKAILGIKKE